MANKELKMIDPKGRMRIVPERIATIGNYLNNGWSLAEQPDEKPKPLAPVVPEVAEYIANRRQCCNTSDEGCCAEKVQAIDDEPAPEVITPEVITPEATAKKPTTVKKEKQKAPAKKGRGK